MGLFGLRFIILFGGGQRQGKWQWQPKHLKLDWGIIGVLPLFSRLFFLGGSEGNGGMEEGRDNHGLVDTLRRAEEEALVFLLSKLVGIAFVLLF